MGPEVDEVGVQQDVVGGAEGVVCAEEHGCRLGLSEELSSGESHIYRRVGMDNSVMVTCTCLGIFSSSLSFIRFSGAVLPAIDFTIVQ